MTRLVLRDATRRYGADVVLLLLGGAYLWRSLPPWVVRAWLWTSPPEHTAVAIVTALALYLAATEPVARQLIASRRLSYWQQFAIPRAHWRRLHATHLAVLNAPLAAAIGYLVAPLDTLLALPTTAIAYASVVAAQAGLASRTRSTVRPWLSLRIASGPAAIARLYAVALWRKERAAVVFSLGCQAAAGGLAVLGSLHVATNEPDAAWPLIATLALLGGLAAGWPALVAARAVDADRWFLDAFGIPRRTEVAGRIGMSVVLGCPTIAAATLAGASLGPSATARAVAIGFAAVGFAAAAFFAIATRAEAARGLHDDRAGAVTLRAIVGFAAVHLGGPAALLVAAAVEVGRGWRALPGGTDARARLETNTTEDDHG